MKSAHDLVELARPAIKETSIAESDESIKNATAIIDVREPEEYRAGHIPGAINIPRGVLEFKLGMVPGLDARDVSLLLYCKSSGRSALACKSLQEMGYMHTESLQGGFDAWLAAGKTVAKPESVDFD